MIYETTNFSSKSKLSSKDIFNSDFLKEKDEALKPIEFLFDSVDIIEDEHIFAKKQIKRKSKIKGSSTFNSNIIFIDSESVNSNEPTFNYLVEKEIEKINSLK